MDAVVTDLLRTWTMPGSPGGRPPVTTRRSRWSLRSLWLALERLARMGPQPESGMDGLAVDRRRALYAYTGMTIMVAAALLAWSSVTLAPRGGIDPHLGKGTILEGPSGGLLLWLAYGLLGSLRTLRAPGGTLMTFHMPFVGAAMILGGPTAGGWVALLSTIERRELESQPWYGILFNHASLVLGAILGGITTLVVAAVLGPDGGATASFVAAAAGTIVLAVVSIGLGIGTVLLRDDVSPRAFVEDLVSRIGRISVVESALVIVLAATYTALGWWAPLLVGGFVILVWDNDPMPEPDPLTGLQVRKGFERRLEAGLGRMRRGLTPGATLMGIDLDRFKSINDDYGHAVGDEVLRTVGTRLLEQARRPNDVAGRQGGDEMALFLPGLADVDTAMRRADEVATAVSRPIVTSVGVLSIGVSIGVLVVRSWGGVASSATMLRHADQAMYHAKRNGSRVHLYDPDEPAPPDVDKPAVDR
jgi:diguanylate cyclase (GGDEF)-like protein